MKQSKHPLEHPAFVETSLETLLLRARNGEVLADILMANVPAVPDLVDLVGEGSEDVGISELHALCSNNIFQETPVFNRRLVVLLNQPQNTH